MDPNQPQPGAPAGQKDDYLDKAFNAGAKKFGGAQGQKIAGDKAKSEKIVSLTALSPNPLGVTRHSLQNVVHGKPFVDNSVLISFFHRPTACAKSTRS